jgi:hypothetical protein
LISNEAASEPRRSNRLYETDSLHIPGSKLPRLLSISPYGTKTSGR